MSCYPVSFTIPGDEKCPPVLITLLEVAGGVQVTAKVDTTSGLTGDLRGLFFQLSGANLAGISVTGADVTEFQAEENEISDLGQGANVNGLPQGPYDLGVEIGTQGVGKDDIQETTFVVAGVTLDAFENMDLAARLTSVGTIGGSRADSCKSPGKVPDFSDVSGMKYHDLDGDGVKDAGEGGVAGVTIYIDKDNDGVLDPGECKTTTDAQGNYSFDNLPPGTYTIREDLSGAAWSDWYQTSPADGHTVAVSGTDVTGKNFGNARYAEVKVCKYLDKDGDGTIEPGYGEYKLGAGWVFAIDLNKDGDYADAGEKKTTDSTGCVTFDKLKVGVEYTVVELLTDAQKAQGYYQTAGIGATVKPTLSNQVLPELKIGNVKYGKVEVCKYEDKNGDGNRDYGEGPLAGFKIWVDLDKDSVVDANETQVTDADGCVTFTSLKIGETYTVKEILTAEQEKIWNQTDADPATVKASYSGQKVKIDFGNQKKTGAIEVCKYHDKDGDGKIEPGYGEYKLGAGWIFAVDLNKDGDYADAGEKKTTDSTGCVKFEGLEIGKSYEVVELLTDAQKAQGWYQTVGEGGIDVTPGYDLKKVAFGNVKYGKVEVCKYEDKNGDGNRDYGEGPLAGFKIWVDLDKDSVVDANETQVTDADGCVTFTSLKIGETYTVKEILTAEQEKIWNQTDADPATVKAIYSGQQIKIDFGNQKQPDDDCFPTIPDISNFVLYFQTDYDDGDEGDDEDGFFTVKIDSVGDKSIDLDDQLDDVLAFIQDEHPDLDIETLVGVAVKGGNSGTNFYSVDEEPCDPMPEPVPGGTFIEADKLDRTYTYDDVFA